MGNIQIPNLPPVTSLDGTELIEVVQNGVSRRTSLVNAANLATYAQEAGNAQTAEFASQAAQAANADNADFATLAGLVPATGVQIASNFQWPQSAIPEFPVARTFYVTMAGSDANTGTSISKPLATINAAIVKAAALGGAKCVIIVQPGVYTVQPYTEIPPDSVLYSYDLRATTLNLPVGQEENNMFLLNNGCKVRGFTFGNLRHEAAPVYANEGAALAATTYGDHFKIATTGSQLYMNDGTATPLAVDYPYPPQKGYAFAMKPGIFLTRSPYIGDCSQLHSFTQAEMRLPMDKAAGNPDMPRGGGNLILDGSILDPDSPLRSVVVDSFTAINPNGVGYLIQKGGFVQLVSVFTNWSRVGLWAHLGGQMTVANSNNTFGDYAMVATGFRLMIEIIDGVPSVEYDDAANLIDVNIQAWADELLSLYQSIPSWSTSYDVLARRDTVTLLQQLANDLRSGQERASQYFVKALFNWNARFNVGPDPETTVPFFISAWEIVDTFLNAEFTAASVLGGERVSYLINDIIISVTSQMYDYLYASAPAPSFLTGFPSVIEATGQQFSNAGSGVNYNALPPSQRGTGISPDPLLALLKRNGGQIYATFATENGDTYLGEDIRVDFKRSVIEGQAFSRGVQNITLPLIIALGG